MPETYRRTGPDSKCPACGWRIDSDAYRCPKCLIYFCYKCRKRVQKDDYQFQCVNQTCACHGKLLCIACTVMVPEEGDISHYNEGSWSGVLWFAGITGLISMIWLGLWGGVLVAAVLTGIGAWLVTACGGRLSDTTSITRGVIREHRSCIQCHQPTEVLNS